MKNKTWIPFKMENLEYLSENLCCIVLISHIFPYWRNKIL